MLILLLLAAASIIGLILYYASKIRAFHVERDESWEFCAVCDRPTSEYAPWGCGLCPEALCSEPCAKKHRREKHDAA